MHKDVHQYIKGIKRIFPYKFRNKRVIELGSQNINGSCRKHFWFPWKGSYLGVDLMAGKDVDLVGVFHELTLPKHFQTAICIGVGEHDRYWKESLLAMYDCLEPGGLLIYVAAGPHHEVHGTETDHPGCSPGTLDYYRNISVEDVETTLPPDLFRFYVLENRQGKRYTNFYGIKK